MVEAEALAMAEQGLVSIWEEPVGTVELCFAHAAGRDSDPLIDALRRLVKEIWREASVSPRNL
jgi:hypothetical protein